MLRPLCLLLLALLLAGALVATLRVEAYTTTPEVEKSVCPQYAMYEATDIGGTGFAPQLLAPSASDCSLDYVRKLPGLSPESSEAARKATKAAANQDQDTTEQSAIIGDTRVGLEKQRADAEVGAL
jgi:hypothetical protein